MQERRMTTLLQVAKPYLSYLASTLGERDYIVFITDIDGKCLLMNYNPSMEKLAEKYGLGTSWSGGNIGTNGIEKALATSGTVLITGTEHSCEDLTDCTTIGTPIKTSTGTLLGILGAILPCNGLDNWLILLLEGTAFSISREFSYRFREDDAQVFTEENYHNPFIGVIVVDNHGVIKKTTDSAKRHLLINSRNLIGQKVTTLFRDFGEKDLEDLVSEKTPAVSFIERVESGGQTKWVEVWASQHFASTQCCGVVFFIWDISERIALESKAHYLKHDETTADLIIKAAHDLRNPLSTIRAAAQLGLISNDPAKISELFLKIQAYTDALDEFIEEILYLGRPQAKALRQVQVLPIIKIAVAQVEQSAAEAGIKIEVRVQSEDLSAMIEPKSLLRALINLVRNSVQAMPNGGYIEIVLQQDDPEFVEISVRDTGSGIPPNIRERIFEPFFTTKTGGTGLGLSIVQQCIVDVHRGKVEVISEIGEGTVFRLLLRSVK
jgi:PAS domain S-box-containing protein